MTDETSQSTNSIDRTYHADEVREIINRLQDEQITHTDNVAQTVEGFAKRVVEEGTYTPEAKVTADLSLTLRERFTGEREQDVTAMVIVGMMLGSALERDVPMDTALEDAWRDGAFELPNCSVEAGTQDNGGDCDI